MKKTIIALIALAGMSLADTITLDESFYKNPNTWVYLWNSTTSSWDILDSVDDTGLWTGSNQAPSADNGDPSFYGYTFSVVDGVQTLTGSAEAITLAAPAWVSGGGKGVYIGSNVTLTGNDNGLRANANIHFGDIASSQFKYTDQVWKKGDANVYGSLTLSSDVFSHTFFSVANMREASGGWNFSSFSVTDAAGNSLTYTTDEDKIGKAGYFWVEETAFTQGSAYTATLKALAVPEPTTATLSLLALAGLAARRRRK